MSRVRKLSFAAALICSPAVFPAFATQSSDTERSIVVTGEATVQSRKAATEYLKQLGLVVGERPAARWEDAICLKAVGLPQPLVERVEAQARSTVSMVGARLATGACTPNLLIAFSEDAPGLVREISGRQTLGDVTYEDRRDLETGAFPIRWWYTTEFRGENGSSSDGSVGSPATMASVSTYGSFGGGLSGRSGGMNDQRTASLVSTSVYRAIRHATVVIDVNRASGKKLKSVIDFATMVALAEVRRDASPQTSILSLFQPSGFDRMTKMDLALLKGLYTMPIRRKADQHRRVLVEGLAKARF